MNRTRLILAVLLMLGAWIAPGRAADLQSFPPPLASYHDEGNSNLAGLLLDRAQAQPVNVIATTLFLLAIIHTFLAPRILAWSHPFRGRAASLVHLLGEIELIFALWVIPLAVALLLAEGPAIEWHYFRGDVSYTEPLFVVVIMAIAASRPIVRLAAWLLALVAGSSPARWWFALLTLAPLLGSFITEPAAMTLCALLLGREFFRLEPGLRFRYATLGLLFVNVSVGGGLTPVAAPPVLIVAARWHWDTAFMLQQFGVRIVAGMIVNNVIYYLIFRREFAQLAARRREHRPEEAAERDSPPCWIIAVHLFLLGWTIFTAHRPLLFLAGFVAFLLFTWATRTHQDKLDLRAPLLVGLFLAGLVIHGGLQGWWIQPLLGRLSEIPLLLSATILTAFNDNAAITYLATLVPNLSDPLKIAVVSGAICGGGLTVIANAPNPAGQTLLQKYFPGDCIAPGGLFLAALFPTLVMLVVFALPK